MAIIKSFNALRYTPLAGEISSLVCPPYDIIPENDYGKYTSRNKYNIIRAELPQSANPGEGCYDAAAEFIKAAISEGALAKDEKAGIYIYEIQFNAFGKTMSIKGIIPLVKLYDWSEGVILPHEETLSKAKTDRLNLMKATGCNFSQIYSLYSDTSGSIKEIIDKESSGKPIISFTDDEGLVHRLFVINDENSCSQIAREFSDKKLYIADGHHRYETAINYRNYLKEWGLPIGTSEYVPMFLCPLESDGLVVFPTHRIVHSLENFNRSEVIEKCREHFEVTEFLNREKGEEGLYRCANEGKTAFVFFTGDNNYTLLKLKNSGEGDVLSKLDVSVLHSLLLENIFGIDKSCLASQTNLTYTRSSDEAISAVDQQRANCCFLINATKVSQIKDVSIEGKKMPQKSTYFYPKLITGLVLNKII